MSLPINLKYSGPPPDAHGQAVPLPVDDQFIETGDRLFKKGEFEKAIESYAKSSHMIHAARRIGECYESLGDYITAKRFYKIHAQYNPMNRMRPSFNEFIREACRINGVRLIDLEAAIDDLSENSIPAPELFMDYCHLTWKGYHLAGSRIVQDIIESKAIRGVEGEPLERPSQDRIIKTYHWDILYSLPAWNSGGRQIDLPTELFKMGL